MNARQKDWIMVRVRREVHAQLEALRTMWIEKEVATHIHKAGHKFLEEPSLSDVIAELIRRDADHRKRSKSQRASKKAGRQSTEGNVVAVSEGQ